MKNYTYVNSINEDILYLLNKWRILNVKGLYELLNGTIGYVATSKRLKKLYSENFLNTYRHPHNNQKFYYLTKDSTSYLFNESKSEINQKEIIHDISTVTIVRELIYNTYFNKAYFFEESYIENLDPDALLFAHLNDQIYKTAVEIELHQKSEKRVKEKFKRYAQSKAVDRVIYFFHRSTPFFFYQKLINELKEDKYPFISKKIILVHEPSIITGKPNFEKTKCLFNENTYNFLEILGGKNEKTN